MSDAFQAYVAGSNLDAAVSAGGRAAGESPDGLVVVALEGIDGDEELRLALFQRRQSKQGRGDYEGTECQTFTVCGGGGGVFSM